ncbi:hypothetical protein [uncultured Desulfovibrio sp.]|uniref:beta strand repeat-containing protein n=1 Tax=uncultured Desulfovibrio sp. TaxID=167968 RepID=UPI0026095776|nr:hypothetical protein [uncultured Desulfovibrio sp.]
MSAPAWFNYATYVANKLAQLQSADPEAGWTSESLQAAFTAAGYSNDADGMYQHFVDWGNAENVSPSPYFVVSEYMANKLAQLQSAEPAAGWDMTKLEQAFKDAGLSAWDHYTLYGQDEGISPSSLFDNNAYLSAKLAQLQSTEPDAGWESVDQVVDAFQAAGLNPIEHYMLYGVSEALTYTPVAPVDPETPVTNELTVDRDVLNLGAGDHVIGGVASALSAEKTLNENDLIDGGDGNDTLRVTMNGNFNGFTVTSDPDTTGGMTNVENVELINNGSIGRTFSAKGIEGATTYTLKAGDSGIGAINLKDLSAAGITVNVDGLKSGSTSVQFASDALSGTEDSLTLGLTNVGTAPATDGGSPTSAKVSTTDGLESVTINASGPNYVNLSGINASSLGMTGSGALNITDVNAAVKSFDGSAATGNVIADLTAAEEITSIVGTQGDDTFTVKNLATTATIEGGAGNDTLWVVEAEGTLRPTVSGFETIGFQETANPVTVSSQNAQDFTAVSLKDANVTVAKLNTSAFTVNSLGNGNNTQNTVTLTDAVQLTVNVEASDTSTETINTTIDAQRATDAEINVGANVNTTGSRFELGNASSVQLNVTGNMVDGENQTTFNATLNAAKATDLIVAASADVTLQAASDLGKVTSLSVTQDDGKFDATNIAFESLSSLTISGSGDKDDASVFGNLGSASMENELSVVASGLAAGLMLGAVSSKADVTLDFSNMDGDVTVANGGVITGNNVSVYVPSLGDTHTIGDIAATGNVTVDAADNLSETLNIGEIAVEQNSSNSSRSLGIDVTVGGNAALTVGDITNQLDKGSVTLNLADYFEEVTDVAVGAIAAKTVNIFGSDAGNDFKGITTANLNFTGGVNDDIVEVTAQTGAFKATLNTDAGVDDVTITANDAGTTSITLTGDMGGNNGDVLKFTLTGATGLTSIDLSKLDGYTANFDLATAGGTFAGITVDTLKLGTGQDTLKLAATAAQTAPTEIHNFTMGVGGDILDLSALAIKDDSTFVAGALNYATLTSAGLTLEDGNVYVINGDISNMKVANDAAANSFVLATGEKATILAWAADTDTLSIYNLDGTTPAAIGAAATTIGLVGVDLDEMVAANVILPTT